MAKSPPPISREEFMAQAQPVEIEIAGQKMTAQPKQFSTGSYGWYLTGKATIMVNGKAVPVQVGTNLTVIGSKQTG
jgi:hypothetical protein